MTANSQARPGNDNARGRRDAPTSPTARARAALARSFGTYGQFRNWGGSPDSPNLNGITVTVGDSFERPFLVNFGDGTLRGYASPSAACRAAEAVNLQRQNDAYRARRDGSADLTLALALRAALAPR